MDRNDGISTDGHPENTSRELHMQPGRLDDIESPEAYATRTGQRDVTGEMPGRGGGEEMTDRVTEGEDIGHGQRARPADGLHGADGRVREGEDIGHGIEAHAADGAYNADGRVERGDDIGSGIRARRADEQDPGNPLV
jgi:hypothetical protein